MQGSVEDVSHSIVMTMEEDTQFTFDKFMDDILVKEDKAKRQGRQKEETPQREYIKRYREKPGNRIKIGGN